MLHHARRPPTCYLSSSRRVVMPQRMLRSLEEPASRIPLWRPLDALRDA